MGKPTFCFPNWTQASSIYTPTIAGAGWVDLSKMQGEVLSEMARYPGVNPANTKVVIDLQTTRNVDNIVLPFHNAKPGDKARAELATDAAFTDVVIDSGWVDFFPEMYPYGTLPWGSENWLDGHLTDEQAAGLVLPWIYQASNTALGRYLRISLDFSGNSDGYVDLGQPVASPALTPVYGASYGRKMPFYRDPSTKTRSKGGVHFVEAQKSYRSTAMQLDWLSGDELYGQFYEFVRQYGVSKPFFYIHDPDAPIAKLLKESFMAIAQTIGDPVHTHLDTHSLSIEICQTY
jgi:hypothetical protein